MLFVDALKKVWGSVFFVRAFDSQKNGRIFVSRVFGPINVEVGGCFQSGRYIDRLFHKLLRFIPCDHPVKEVLLLGLGGGGAVREVKKRFAGAVVTAVEYDPVMIEIAKTLYLKPKDQISLQMILGDAAEAVFKMQKKFDVIIVDLFLGQTLSPLLQTDAFAQSLTGCLKKDGYLAVNFFRQKNSAAPVFDRFFSHWHDCRYLINELAIYRHFGEGHVGDPVPH